MIINKYKLFYKFIDNNYYYINYMLINYKILLI